MYFPLSIEGANRPRRVVAGQDNVDIVDRIVGDLSKDLKIHASGSAC